MVIFNIPFLSSYQIHTLFLPSLLGFLLKKKENQDKKKCQVQFFLTWTHGCVAINWYMVYGTGVTNLLQTVFLSHWLSIVSSYSPRGDILCLLYLFMLEIFQDWVYGVHVLPQLLWVYNFKLPWSFHKTLFLCFFPSPLTLIIFLSHFLNDPRELEERFVTNVPLRTEHCLISYFYMVTSCPSVS